MPELLQLAIAIQTSKIVSSRLDHELVLLQYHGNRGYLMVKIGATTIPLAGWAVDPRRPDAARANRLEAIRQLVQEYSLSAVELSMDLGLVYPHVFDTDFYSSVADMQQDLGFTCTVHLPIHWLDLSSANEPVRQASLSCVHRAIELVQPVDVLTYVLHLWGPTTVQIVSALDKPMQRAAVMGALLMQAERSLADLCQVLTPSDDICVENLEEPSFDLVPPPGRTLWHKYLPGRGAFGLAETTPLEFIGRHGTRIRELHLHDALRISKDGLVQTRDHLPLGQGELDYAAVLSRLDENRISRRSDP